MKQKVYRDGLHKCYLEDYEVINEIFGEEFILQPEYVKLFADYKNQRPKKLKEKNIKIQSTLLLVRQRALIPILILIFPFVIFLTEINKVTILLEFLVILTFVIQQIKLRMQFNKKNCQGDLKVGDYVTLKKHTENDLFIIVAIDYEINHHVVDYVVHHESGSGQFHFCKQKHINQRAGSILTNNQHAIFMCITLILMCLIVALASFTTGIIKFNAIYLEFYLLVMYITSYLKNARVMQCPNYSIGKSIYQKGGIYEQNYNCTPTDEIYHRINGPYKKLPKPMDHQNYATSNFNYQEEMYQSVIRLNPPKFTCAHRLIDLYFTIDLQNLKACTTREYLQTTYESLKYTADYWLFIISTVLAFLFLIRFDSLVIFVLLLHILINFRLIIFVYLFGRFYKKNDFSYTPQNGDYVTMQASHYGEIFIFNEVDITINDVHIKHCLRDFNGITRFGNVDNMRFRKISKKGVTLAFCLKLIPLICMLTYAYFDFRITSFLLVIVCAADFIIRDFRFFINYNLKREIKKYHKYVNKQTQIYQDLVAQRTMNNNWVKDELNEFIED